ncbi:hypothetical protein Pure02_05930 [Paenarthrobacter ureafaciens]|nr:hypothetical protein Pure02_05930 [Paenarthrobacter ureafaciens]GLU66617.1 hypothetical protein Pure03_05930 [Paenarthrobacter ureafaciens]
MTRVRVPTVSIANGRRAKRPIGRNPAPASSGKRAKRPGSRDRRGLGCGLGRGLAWGDATGVGWEAKEVSFIIPGSLSVRIVPPPDARDPV